jgi:hypothetical protein
MSEIATPGPPSRPQRAFRVKLRGSILALLRLPNKRELRGKVHQISITGGLVNVEIPLDEKLHVELIFHLGDATIREKAEMLFPMWATQGWMQPFRFIDLSEANKNILDSSLRTFVQNTHETPQAALSPQPAKAAEAS